MKLTLFGATGETGKLLLDQALAAGHEVRGAERDFPEGFCDHPAFEARHANLLEDDLADVVEGSDAVVSAVGLPRDPRSLADPPPLFTEGAVRIVQGMRKAGVKRLVVISAAFVDKDVSIPDWFKAAIMPLRRQFRQMGEMERVLRVADDLDWTAVRPGWLLDRPHTGDYRVGLDDLPESAFRTPRADLADFMLKCASEGLHVRETPFIARKESTEDESPAALIDEVRKGFRL
ncbi:NAD(P)H-binding protein [Sphingomicrobium sp. XHP0235]|uniref:NAD(P)-dependent oxidoreductase n=1 Tax=Sphingomicrobium aquimarinum TaxID=3133971 RepID=UPI0031FF0110